MGGEKHLTLRSDKLTSADRQVSLSPQDDYRHALKSGEHEAFYFPFTSPQADIFGFLRTLFDQDTVLELVALHVRGRVWLHEQRTFLSGDPPPARNASGPLVTLTCREPWQVWSCAFQATVREIAGEGSGPAELALEFVATDAPALYSFGPYHQAQQDGRFRGQLRIGAEDWAGELVGYRDHSWGQRPMGAAGGWTIASAPGRFYIAVGEAGGQRFCFGRLTTPDGEHVHPHAPELVAEDTGWRIKDPKAGMKAWRVKRQAPPLVAYLGGAGQEAIREAPRQGDLLRDEIGPAVFTSPTGEQVMGLFDQAVRLT
jgi:hypothetical protein